MKLCSRQKRFAVVFSVVFLYAPSHAQAANPRGVSRARAELQSLIKRRRAANNPVLKFRVTPLMEATGAGLGPADIASEAWKAAAGVLLDWGLGILVKKICSDAKLDLLVPNSCATLLNSLEGFSVAALRDAVREDIQHLPERLVAVVLGFLKTKIPSFAPPNTVTNTKCGTKKIDPADCDQGPAPILCRTFIKYIPKIAGEKAQAAACGVFRIMSTPLPAGAGDKGVRDKVRYLATVTAASVDIADWLDWSEGRWLTRVVKFVSRLLGVAAAENASDAFSYLKTVASPGNLWRAKRDGFMFSAGFSVGAGFFAEQRIFRSAEVAPAFSPIAAAGFDLSWPLARSATIGLLFTALDLGQLVSIRISQGPGKVTSETGWTQILSPGVYLRFGLPNTPLIVGVGASVAPSLRSFSDAPGDGAFSVIRYGMFLALDVPILAF